jgi:diguanylate cyclase (GGDEF)-like protein/PAS domain S-box-containing protein
MNLTFTPFASVLYITALVSVFVAILAWRRRNLPGAAALVVLMVTVTEWALASGIEAAVVGQTAKIFWAKMEYLGVTLAPTFFLVFTLEYSQQIRFLTRRNLLLLSILPLAGIVMTATNEWHNLVWTSFTPGPVYHNILIFGHGIGYYILIFYDYMIILAGILVLLRFYRHSLQPYRRQIGLVLLGSVFPFIGGLIYSLGLIPIIGLDIAPVAFTATGLLIAMGIFMYQLFDLVPIAREIMIENMGVGVLVLDMQNRIADVNPVAQKILGVNLKDALGKPAAAVLKSWPTLVQQFNNVREVQREIWLNDSNPPRYFDLHITPLYNRHKYYTGRLIVFRDITEHRQTEEELARSVEELRIINRINLMVTSGLDMERVLKTLHEQCGQVAPMDIFYVAIYDESSSLIHIPYYFEDGKSQVGPSRDIRERPGIIGKVIQTRGTHYLLETMGRDTIPLQQVTSAMQKPIRSYLGIPLTVREKVIGVMSVLSQKPDAYTKDQISLLERIAIHAAIAIENARLYAEEQRLAIIDELTNIYNYRGLLELGGREVDRARRFNHPLSALFFDIDGFRKFNNTYSHTTGNIILQTVAQRCRTTLRSVDIFARFGGDEFAALLPETDLASAEEVAKRLSEEIASTKVTTSYGELSVTISIGVTTLTADIPDLITLIDRASQGEKKAKQDGLGVVIVN